MTLQTDLSPVSAEAPSQPTFSNLVACRLGADGECQLDLHEQMNFWTINGGYLGALALRIASQHSNRASPVSIALDFVRAAKTGPAVGRARTISASLVSDLVEVEILQDGKTRAIARVWMADVLEGPDHHQATMPNVPHPEELRPLEEVRPRTQQPLHPFWQVFEQRPINRIDNRKRARIEAQYLRWFRFVGDNPLADATDAVARTLPIIDVHGIMSAAQMYDRPFLTSLAPTVQLSVHFRDVGYRGEWLLCDALCEHAGSGVVSTQVKIWGLQGELVAHGMSQMLVRPGSGAYVGTPAQKSEPTG